MFIKARDLYKGQIMLSDQGKGVVESVTAFTNWELDEVVAVELAGKSPFTLFFNYEDEVTVI